MELSCRRMDVVGGIQRHTELPKYFSAGSVVLVSSFCQVSLGNLKSKATCN